MSTFDKKIFGLRLKEMRLKAGYMRQIDLAEKLGTSVQTISNYESANRLPDAEMLSRIVEILPCNADYLLGFEEKPNYTEAHIADQTGLSDRAVEKLIELAAIARESTTEDNVGNRMLDIMNFILEYDDFEILLNNCRNLTRLLTLNSRMGLYMSPIASNEEIDNLDYAAAMKGYTMIGTADATKFYINRISQAMTRAINDGLRRQIEDGTDIKELIGD